MKDLRGGIYQNSSFIFFLMWTYITVYDTELGTVICIVRNDQGEIPI